jgi:hypothetical protein
MGAVTPARASAERPAVGAGMLAVRIESVAPAIPHKGDLLQIRGTIANSSDQPVTSVSAQLRMSPTALFSRAEIAEILQGGGQRTGLALTEPTARMVVSASLAPGSASPFAVNVPLNDLPLPTAGAYMLGVEALGDSGGGVQRQDMDRTFLPWWPEGTSAEPLLLTVLWPLTGAPLRDAKGVLLSEEPAVELSPAGRLAVLLESAREHPGVATVVADPQVLQAADDLSRGYLVQQDGEATTGTRSREVASWLTQMRAVAADPLGDVSTMLYGQPDLVAARKGRALPTLLRQRPLADQLTAQALGRRLPSDIVLMPDGMTDQPTLRTLAGSDVGVVVLSDTAMPESTDTYFTPSGNLLWDSGDSQLPVLLTDSRLDATLRMPMTSGSEQVAVRQRLLAETLTTALELPESQRLLATIPPSDWAPVASGAAMILDTVDAAPWVTPAPVAEAVAREPSDVARTLAPYPAESGSAEIPPASVTRSRALTADLTTYAAALSDPAGLPAVTRTAPTRIMSGWFRSHPSDQGSLIRAVSRQTADALRSVRVVSSGPITVSGSSGIIPVTVENLGPAAVTVGVTLTASPPQLFSAKPVAPFPIQPGRRSSIEVQVEVNAAGPIPVTIQATTEEGKAFGVPGVLTISSSAYANAARLLVRGSLAILLVTVLVHGIRRARRRSGGALAKTPDPAADTAHDLPADATHDLEAPRG